MISCTEFILAYNELFKLLEERGGREDLERFWERVSDEYLGNLDRLVAQKGIAGMAEYWGHTLTEKAADAEMRADEDRFVLEIYKCPSIDLLNSSGVEKCFCYCAHCDTLYKRVIEKYGFEYKLYIIDPEKGRCRIEVRKVG